MNVVTGVPDPTPLKPPMFTAFYSQWPETQFPGIFDFLGASHQLWHICSMACILK